MLVGEWGCCNLYAVVWCGALYLLPPQCGGKWELSFVVFGVVGARVKAGVLNLFWLQGSNLFESSLPVSFGMGVTVLRAVYHINLYAPSQYLHIY